MKVFISSVSLVILVGLILIACGRGRILRPNADNSVPAPTAPNAQPGDTQQTGMPDRNVLVVSTPDTSVLDAGAEFDVAVRFEFKEEVYQGSGRLTFDGDLVEPMRVVQGEAIPSDAVFMSRLVEPGFVPYAFTSLEGAPGIAAGKGTLLTVRFRLKAKPERCLKMRLLNDAEHLQLRDSKGRRLSFDLSTEVTCR